MAYEAFSLTVTTPFGRPYFGWMSFCGSNSGWRRRGKNATGDRHFGEDTVPEGESVSCLVF